MRKSVEALSSHLYDNKFSHCSSAIPSNPQMQSSISSYHLVSTSTPHHLATSTPRQTNYRHDHSSIYPNISFSSSYNQSDMSHENNENDANISLKTFLTLQNIYKHFNQQSFLKLLIYFVEIHDKSFVYLLLFESRLGALFYYNTNLQNLILGSICKGFCEIYPPVF